jgi:tripartite-type tricarboxylate transporter receptor subunit TctC
VKIPRRRLLRLAAGAAAWPALPRSASAQAWPSRPVRLLVGFPAGGGADVAARIVANRLSEIWRQQVVIENKPGAGGNLAIGVGARANPDGYTMVLVPGAITLFGLTLPSLDYDPAADLAPVTLLGTYPNLLAVPNASPVKSVGDFIAAAKANPGNVTFASPGVGTSPHLSGVLFARMAGIDIRHVPSRGVTTGGMSDLVAGRVDSMFNTAASLLPAVRSGEVRGLAVTSGERFATVPELPTITQSGVPGFDVVSWYALYVPAKTPADIARKMHDDTVAVLDEPAVKAKYEPLGILSGGSTQDALAARVRLEVALWRSVIKSAGIKPEQ